MAVGCRTINLGASGLFCTRTWWYAERQSCKGLDASFCFLLLPACTCCVKHIIRIAAKDLAQLVYYRRLGEGAVKVAARACSLTGEVPNSVSKPGRL